LANLPAPAAEESFETLFTAPGCRIERIVSHGHASPPDFWYDQAEDEWVALLEGEAVLAFADGARLTMRRGDWITIPAHGRHRVEATGPGTVWLAVHCRKDGG
jgi:cupin 2 domain-containing protein